MHRTCMVNPLLHLTGMQYFTLGEHTPSKLLMGVKRLDAYVNDLHILAKSLFLRKHMLIVSSRLAHVYSTQLLLAKTSLSLELMYPMLLLRHRRQSNPSTSNPTKPFVNGGYSSRNEIQFHQDILILSSLQCRAIQRVLGYGRSTLTRCSAR
jgi:hypothetical protein